MSVEPSLAKLIEKAVNGYLQFDPQIKKEFCTLHGKVIGFDITTFDKRIFFLPRQDGTIEVSDICERAPDTMIKARAVDLFRLAKTDDAVGVQAEISGDINLGQKFQRMFGDIEFDWEELLVPWLGDAMANEIGIGVRNLRDWLHHCNDAIADSASAYLRDEARLAVSRAELDFFITEVDRLRDAVDRCEAKLNRLGY